MNFNFEQEARFSEIQKKRNPVLETGNTIHKNIRDTEYLAAVVTMETEQLKSEWGRPRPSLLEGRTLAVRDVTAWGDAFDWPVGAAQ